MVNEIISKVKGLKSITDSIKKSVLEILKLFDIEKLGDKDCKIYCIAKDKINGRESSVVINMEDVFSTALLVIKIYLASMPEGGSICSLKCELTSSISEETVKSMRITPFMLDLLAREYKLENNFANSRYEVQGATEPIDYQYEHAHEIPKKDLLGIFNRFANHWERLVMLYRYRARVVTETLYGNVYEMKKRDFFFSIPTIK